MTKFSYILTLYILALLCFGCRQNQDSLKHAKLLGSQSAYVGEPMDPDAAKYEKLASSDKVKIENREHYMILTTWYIVNACGNCIPNLDVRNDTINLIYKETSEELCMSLSIEEVTYFIDNRNEKNWVVIK